MDRRVPAWLAWASAFLLMTSASARAEDDPREARIRELERKVEVLTEELSQLRTEVAVPETTELKSAYGFGPAASKVYGATRGVSIGGYAEGFYRKFVSERSDSDEDTTDFLRLVLYAGYKFSDRILFNSEIEFEHGTTEPTITNEEGGSVSVEFANLDFLWKDWANARVGMLLMPVGFVNEIHEPPFFHGVARPEVERQIIPTTWRENGLGVFGRVGEQLEYRAYVVNGFNARGFRPSGLRTARQQGSETLADDFAVVGRLDYTPLEGLLLGGSLYFGDSGQDQEIDGVELPDARLTLWEVHGQYRHRGLELRTLFAMSHLEDADDLTLALRPVSLGGIGEIGADDVLGERMLGGYAEIAYDLMQWISPGSTMSFSPFVRFEYLDTLYRVPSGFEDDGRRQIRLWTPGLSFKPHPSVVLKADYRNFDLGKGKRADEVNFGIGLAF